MEALDIAVLPGAARLDVKRVNLIDAEPSLDFPGEIFRVRPGEARQ